jgi:uncharacterized protein YjiS (DUF1127 family)
MRLPTLIAVWAERNRQRRALAEMVELSPHLLADIGVSRAQARKEAAKPFWVYSRRARAQSSRARVGTGSGFRGRATVIASALRRLSSAAVGSLERSRRRRASAELAERGYLLQAGSEPNANPGGRSTPYR